MRRSFLFGALLLSACKAAPPASPKPTVADIPVLAAEPAKEPTFVVEAPLGQPTVLVDARIKAVRHRVAACLHDAIERDPLMTGKSEATFSWTAGEILRDREFDGVLSGLWFGTCVAQTLEASQSNLATAGSTEIFDDLEFHFTFRVNFAGPFTAVHPLPAEAQRGEERWSVLSEADDGTLTLSAARPTEVSPEALLRCRVPQKTSIDADGGWLVGRIDRTGELTLPPPDNLEISDDTPCLRRVLSRATFSPGPVRYFKVQTHPNLDLGLSTYEENEKEMVRLDAQAVAQAASESKPPSAETPSLQAQRIASELDDVSIDMVGVDRGADGWGSPGVPLNQDNWREGPLDLGKGAHGLGGASAGPEPQTPRPDPRKGFDGKPFARLVASEAVAEAAPLADGSRLTGLWFVKGSVDQDSPIVAIARGPESQVLGDCYVRDAGVELRFFPLDPANAASACKDFAAKHVRPLP